MRRSLIALLSLGCGQPIVFLERPPLEAKAFVVVLQEANGLPQIVVTAADSFELALEKPSSESLDITVVGLSLSLEELGLDEGALPIVERGVPLAAIARSGVVRAMFRGEEWSEWMREEELPSSLAGASIPRTGCSEPIDRSLETLDRDDPVAFAGPVGDTSALVVVGSRALIFKDVQGIVQSAELPIPFAGGDLDLDRQRAYLGSGDTSALYTIDVDTLEVTFTASTSEPSAGFLRWMDSDGDSLVALSSTGKIFRRDGAVMRQVGSIDVAGPNTDVGGVLMLEPDQVLIGADNNPDLHRLDGDRLITEIQGAIDSKGFVALAQVPGLGPVTVELDSGQILSRAASDWVPIGRGMQEVRLIHAIGEGRFIIADAFGRWNEVHPVHGLGCGLVESNVLNEAQALFQLGGAVYGVGLGQSGVIEIAHLAQIE